MLAYLALGLSMGLTSGLSPGPLMTLVVTASLRSGFRGGLRVALAPLLTDVPIIALSVLIIGNMPPTVLRWVGTVGSLVVIWMGVETIRSARTALLFGNTVTGGDPGRELWRGVLVNALNPHPYLFWATVGGPTLVGGWRASPWYALAFVVPFYVMLLGSKVILAWVVGSQSGRLSEIWYRRLLTGCGLLLVALGAFLMWQTWHRV